MPPLNVDGNDHLCWLWQDGDKTVPHGMAEINHTWGTLHKEGGAYRKRTVLKIKNSVKNESIKLHIFLVLNCTYDFISFEGKWSRQ